MYTETQPMHVVSHQTQADIWQHIQEIKLFLAQTSIYLACWLLNNHQAPVLFSISKDALWRDSHAGNQQTPILSVFRKMLSARIHMLGEKMGSYRNV